MTCFEIYKHWESLGGEVTPDGYIHPIEALKEFSQYTVETLEAILDSGLIEDLKREGLAT